MAKKAKAVAKKKAWTPIIYAVEIGENEYEIEPQPITIITQFDGLVQHMSDNLLSFKRHWVVYSNGTGDLHREGPFDLDEAEEHVKTLDLAQDQAPVIEVDDFPWKEFFANLAEAPYHLLKLLIPELTEEDADSISLPQLMWLVDLLIEVNGIEWFKAVLKNLGTPLLREMGEAMIDTATAATRRRSALQKLASSTETDSTGS